MSETRKRNLKAVHAAPAVAQERRGSAAAEQALQAVRAAPAAGQAPRASEAEEQARQAAHAVPAAARGSRTSEAKKELQALQAALAAEHAAVYGYGVVGGRVGEGRRGEARAAYDAHRARRDALTREVRDLGGQPVAAAAGYALPFPVPDSATAVRFAAELEDRVAAVYSDLVRAATGERRREAAGALREAAVRAVRWRGESVAFPGLAERAGTPTASAAPTM